MGAAGALPGATAAGGVSALPLSQMFAWGPITLEGRPLQPGEAFINVDLRIVAGNYFRAMEIPLLKGRLFTEQDTRTQPRVVIIDDFMAQQLWPNEEPLGKRIRSGGIDASATAPWQTVVGVVGASSSTPSTAIRGSRCTCRTRRRSDAP